MVNYSNVTEIPGQKATSSQLSMMMTRYHLAKLHSVNKDVLEVACGSGTGLGYISEAARSVVGGDIDVELVKIATNNYDGTSNVKVQILDAQNLTFSDNSFDLILLFEAIYYIPDVDAFIAEALRVVRPGGKIIIATVNCDWHGFNPSPYSVKYYQGKELLTMFEGKAKSELLVGFKDMPTGSNYYTSQVRRIAAKFGLIPNTMKSKEKLKRLFYGKLKPIPIVLYEGLAKVETLIPYEDVKDNDRFYKQLYLVVEV